MHSLSARIRTFVLLGTALLFTGCMAQGPTTGSDDPAKDETLRRSLTRAIGWMQPIVHAGDYADLVTSNDGGQVALAEAMYAWMLAAGAADASQEVIERLDARISDSAVSEGFAFDTWLVGGASFYLLECSLRDERTHPALKRMLPRLLALRNSEGAWTHGASEGSIPGYPSTILAASHWALFGIGAATHCGESMPEGAVDTFLGLLAQVQTSGGGLPYGGRSFRMAVETGRTAGALVGLAAIGKAQSSLFKRSAAFVTGDWASVPDGHASAAMHVMNGALAAYALGEGSWQAYVEEVLLPVVQQQAEDGSFGMIREHASGDLGSPQSSALFRTGLCVAALAVPQTRVGAWLRDKVRGYVPAPPTFATETAVRRPSWTRTISGALCLSNDDSGPVVLTRDGTIHLMTVDGSVRTVLDPSVTLDKNESYSALVVGTSLFAWSQSAHHIFSVDLESGSVRWQTHGESSKGFVRRAGERLDVFGRSGHWQTIDLRTGQRGPSREVPVGLLRTAICLGKSGAVVSADHLVERRDVSGKTLWQSTLQSAGSTVPPVWTAHASLGDQHIGGTSAGVVSSRTLSDGTPRWSVQLEAGITSLLPVEIEGHAVAVVEASGRVSLISSTGNVLWSVESTARAHSRSGQARLYELANELWVQSPSGERLVSFSPAGTRCLEIEASAAALFASSDEDIWVLEGPALHAYRAIR